LPAPRMFLKILPLLGLVLGSRFNSSPQPTSMPTTAKLGAFRSITVPTFERKYANADQFNINGTNDQQKIIDEFWRSSGAFLAKKNPLKTPLTTANNMPDGFYFHMQRSPFLQADINDLPWRWETVNMTEDEEGNKGGQKYAAEPTREPWATLSKMSPQELCPPGSLAHWTVNWYTSMNWMDDEKNEWNTEKASHVVYHGERDLYYGSGAAWGTNLTAQTGDLVVPMNDPNARFDPEYVGMDFTVHPQEEADHAFGSFGQYQGFGHHNMGDAWKGKGWGYKGETNHKLQRLPTSSGEYYYFCSQRNAAVTYILGKYAFWQKSFVHGRNGPDEYQDDRKMGTLTLPEVATSSDAQNRKFWLVIPGRPVGCTGERSAMYSFNDGSALQHWSPMKHSSHFWQDVADLNAHHLPYYNMHPRVPAVVKNLYNEVFTGKHTNTYSGCYERYVKGLYMGNQVAKHGAKDANKERVQQNFAPFPATGATQEMMLDLDGDGQEPEIQLRAHPLRLIFLAPDGKQYTWLKSKAYLGPTLYADNLENVKKTACGDGTAAGTMVGWAPWMKRRAQVFCNDDFCNLHPYGTQLQGGDQRKTIMKAEGRRPNWLWNLAPDAPTWHMIEMDYTSEKRYDVSHCFNHVYVPENATYESWTNQVCTDPRGCLPVRLTTNPCIWDQEWMESNSGPFPGNMNITLPRGGSWDAATRTWTFDDTPGIATKWTYPRDTIGKTNNNFVWASYGVGVHKWFNCDINNGWYNGTFKSGNTDPSPWQTFYDFHWVQHFIGAYDSRYTIPDTNAGRKRREGDLDADAFPRGEKPEDTRTALSTEELERSSRSSHTLRSEYLNAEMYDRAFPFHTTKYTGAVDADTDIYWDMNNAQESTAGHPTIVQHLDRLIVDPTHPWYPEVAGNIEREWSRSYDIKWADQAIFSNDGNTTTGEPYDHIVKYMDENFPNYFDEASFTAVEIGMMKFAAWQYLEGISFPLKNWIYGLFVGVSNTLTLEDTWDLRYPLCTGANCPDSCDAGTTAQVLFDCYMAIDERKWVANEHITDMPELAEEKNKLGDPGFIAPNTSPGSKNFHSEIILTKGSDCTYDITILTDCDGYAQILTAQPENLFNRKADEVPGLITPMMDLDLIHEDIQEFWEKNGGVDKTTPAPTTQAPTTTQGSESSATLAAPLLPLFLFAKLFL